jgi:putative hydrolase of the HAD superfamily
MSIKAILFDVDGIVITGRKHYFSYKLSKEHNISTDSVEEFFLKDFKDCTFGRADLKEKISAYLIKWGWKGTVEDLLEYWFSGESTTNNEVLDIIKTLRSKGIRCYIATRQEKYRLSYLLNNVGLKEHFDGVFCTCDIGYEKWEPEFFDFVFRELKLKPEEVMFFDDTAKNIDAISVRRVQAYFYENINTLKKHTDPLLN